MFSTRIFFFLCLFAVSLAIPEGRQSFFIIDEFHDAMPLLLILEDEAPPEVFKSGSNQDGNIVGLERDIEIAVHDASSGAFAVSAIEDQLSYSSPPSSVSTLLVQYDGIDEDTDDDDDDDDPETPDYSAGTRLQLNPTGLNGADFTAAGRADAIFIEISTDLDTTLEMTVYTDAQTTSVYSTTIFAEFGLYEIEIPFADFVGSADFTNVGALETRIFATTSVDAVYSELFTTGPTPNNRVYMMNPLPCAPEWPNNVPEFETSSYSTTYTTTTSSSDDDSDITTWTRSRFPFGSSLSSAEANQLLALASPDQLSSDELRHLFEAGLDSSEFASAMARNGNGRSRDGSGSSSSSSSSSSASSLRASVLLAIALVALF